ncbi:MAG TPA: 7-cyano-7-deazaguanine synthase QueC [Candidatus Hydrogenedentes bacterium]|nr:7-cyano-7-deazaguanine synthase QueC [Candidatus Hydrogenedentota bacterium]HPC15416.1 7-cyano-7-deazaguanine synthase QueC [Candidatus Hydrogenedentota bacterium]HRT21145.1 7-cyano-7-deazaguanine synthase QueC [Candidatus Hydrogenedentota bacterium]HRT64370.1 7-cyano-7-deazaguanine synthase QueC [Candidatus Hydrogenedentota bacterium]
MKTHGRPAVVLLSGGADSTVLLCHAGRHLGHAPLHAISFRYGQRHARELACAAHQAERAGALHTVLDISFMGALLREGSALVAGGAAVPSLADLAAEDLEQPPTYVPNRNMMLLAMAAAYAEARGICDVYYGAQAQDEYGYWDCTPDFVRRLNRVLALNRRNRVWIHAPFAEMRKSEIIRLGLDLGVDFAHTWSCYRGGECACGTCPTCVERLNAFAATGVVDPVPYMT